MRNAYPSSAKGSTLLWAVGVLVLLSVVGATIAKMSPSSLQGKLEQEAGMRAYYNANSGLNYILGMESANETGGGSFANFLANMGGGSSVTMNLSGDDYYSFKLGNTVTSGNNGTYQITSLVGGVKNSAGSTPYAYVVYGGGKGNSAVQQYTVTPSGSGFGKAISERIVATKSTFSFGGTINGDIYADQLDSNEGSILGGNLISASADKVLEVPKNTTGSSGSPLTICSNNGIKLLESGMTLYANITAQGDIYIARPVVGTIKVGGNVTFNRNASITGNIYTAKEIDTTNGHIYGNAHVNNYTDVYGSGDRGTIIVEEVKVPDKCTTLNSWPEHETPTTTVDFNASSSPLCSGSNCTFTGSGIDDHTFSYRNFTVPWGYNVCFDLSAGYVNIFISGYANITPQNVYIKTTSSQRCFTGATQLKQQLGLSYKSYASKLYMDVTGDFSLQGGVWFGTVYAGTGIKLGSGTWMSGALYSDGGTITGLYGSRPDLHMDYVASDYFAKR